MLCVLLSQVGFRDLEILESHIFLSMIIQFILMQRSYWSKRKMSQVGRAGSDSIQRNNDNTKTTVVHPVTLY